MYTVRATPNFNFDRSLTTPHPFGTQSSKLIVGMKHGAPLSLEICYNEGTHGFTIDAGWFNSSQVVPRRQ